MSNNLQELKNEVRFVDENHIDIPENTDSINEETLLGLGGEISVGKIKLPPPTPGALMLLEMIESPFVVGGTRTFTLDDIFNALYIICRGREAVAPLMLQIRVERKGLEAFDKTEKTPQHLEVYNRFLERNANRADVFDSEVKEFAFECGAFDPIEASVAISDFITMSMGGFETIPSRDDGDNFDKKKD